MYILFCIKLFFIIFANVRIHYFPLKIYYSFIFKKFFKKLICFFLLYRYKSRIGGGAYPEVRGMRAFELTQRIPDS